MCATVDIRDGNDMAASSKRLEDDSSSGRAGGEGQGVLGLLKGGNAVLEVGPVGVGGACVLVLADRVADSSLRKGGGQRDGLDHSTSRGVVRRTGMDGECAELVDGRCSPRRGLDGAVVELRDSHVCVERVVGGVVVGECVCLRGRLEGERCRYSIDSLLSSLVLAAQTRAAFLGRRRPEKFYVIFRVVEVELTRGGR